MRDLQEKYKQDRIKLQEEAKLNRERGKMTKEQRKEEDKIRKQQIKLAKRKAKADKAKQDEIEEQEKPKTPFWDKFKFWKSSDPKTDETENI